ncbi:Transcriptional regulator/sugar kinase [Planctomycetales bacterium 10988]|nr:Transcriptional regulator/sugar kinase [Planctomycetales bacterium 10988]
MAANERTFLPLSQATPPYFIGVDLGGTNIKTGLVDDRGNTLAFTAVKTEVPAGADAGVGRMAQSIETVLQEVGLTKEAIAGVGLGSPGPMDIPAGMLLEPVNLEGWDYFPLRDRLQEKCEIPVTFSNDANAAAYGEFWIGSGREYHSMIMITLGTGVGGGIIIGDLSIDGEHSHGSELGHLPIFSDPNARICSCHQRGHLEAYASATALINRTYEALRAGRKSSLAQLVAEGQELNGLNIAQAAEAGDELAEELIMETADFLGLGMVIFLHTIDPAAIVIGGAMTFGRDETELGRRFLKRIHEVALQRAFPVPAQKVVLRYATLGGDAGYIGAAGRARVDYYQQKMNTPGTPKN